MKSDLAPQLPRLTQAAAPLTREVDALDEYGARRSVTIPAERALTVFVDKRELVTLMTLGVAPELLVLGYLRNQRLVASADRQLEVMGAERPADAALGEVREVLGVVQPPRPVVVPEVVQTIGLADADGQLGGGGTGGGVLGVDHGGRR